LAKTSTAEGSALSERILIAGCGYVGSELARRLADHGHTVWGLRRSVDALPPGVRPFAADLSDPTSLTALPAHLDVVVYAASAHGFSDEAYQAAYVEGCQHLILALEQQAHKPRHTFFVSSTGVYGQTDGSDVDETTEPMPNGFSGRRMLEGETLWHQSPWPATALRLAGIYGPGRTRFLESVRAGTAKLPDAPRWTNRIHRDDCAGILHHLIELSRSQAIDPVYIGVDDAPTPLGDVIRWLAAELNAPTPQRAESSGGSRRRPVTNKRCRNARIKATGYTFEVATFRDGYGALIADTGV